MVEAIPTFKLSTGAMGEGVISPLLNCFLSPFGSCCFVKATVQTTSERGCRWGGGADKHCHFHVMKTILDDGHLRAPCLY